MSATKLYGLVLAGGRSKRMGTDKGHLVYHNKPQREHAYSLLDEVCEKTYFSIRQDQESEIGHNFNFIIDNDKYKGPYNGIISAHLFKPEVAWLILAIDLPLLKVKDLKSLIHARNTGKAATAYATKESGLPEPLIAIWEPSGLKQSLEFLNSDIGTCPRKFLINSEIELVYPADDKILLNANTIADVEIAKRQLQ